MVGARLDEQQLDAAVGRGLERLLPADRRAGVLRRELAPALDGVDLAGCPPSVDDGLRSSEDLRRRRVRLGARPADQARAHLAREAVLELGAAVLRADEDDAAVDVLADAQVERVGDALPVARDDRVDVPLVPRLRPATLVMAAGHLLGLVGDL